MNYVIGDVHCQIHALTTLLEKLNIKDDDIVYFTGDFMDRAITHEDEIETVKWFVNNISNDGQYRSVKSNHDDSYCHEMDRQLEFNKILESEFGQSSLTQDPNIELKLKFKEIYNTLPLYYEIIANDRKYIVTHSWIVYNNEIGYKGEEHIYKEQISEQFSFWDRDFSVDDYSYCSNSNSYTIIHGHTITGVIRDTKSALYNPTYKIHKIGDYNINVDCGAFLTPIFGGNLAAYRIEDGKEFYAYDDHMQLYSITELNADKEYSRVHFNKFLILYYSIFNNPSLWEDISYDHDDVNVSEEVKLAIDYANSLKSENKFDLLASLSSIESKVGEIRKYWSINKDMLLEKYSNFNE